MLIFGLYPIAHGLIGHNFITSVETAGIFPPKKISGRLPFFRYPPYRPAGKSGI